MFLDLNGVTVGQPDPELYDLTIAVAEGRLEKEELASALRRLATASRE